MSKNKKKIGNKYFKVTDKRSNNMVRKFVQGFGFQMVDDSDRTPVDVNEGWDNSSEELRVVSACGRKPEGPLSIIFSRVVKNKIDLLMKRFPHTEWLAYLIGDETSRYAKDLFLPIQEVNSASVHVTGAKPDGTIGVIHSHHSMGAFFSGTDDTYINQNNDISVVVAHNGIKAQVRWITPCGYKVVTEGKVIVQSENLFDEVEFLGQVDTVVNDAVVSYVADVNKRHGWPLKTANTAPIPKELRGVNTPSHKYTRGSNLLGGIKSQCPDINDDNNEVVSEDDLRDALTTAFGMNNAGNS